MRLVPGGLLVEPATPRAEALAGAAVAVVGDEGSVFVNPAGMAPIRRTTMGGSGALGPGGARWAAAAGVLRVGRLSFGLGAAARAYGDTLSIELPTGSTVVAAPNLESWAALGVGAVAYRRGIISVGASLKALREHVSDSVTLHYGATSVTGDVGLAVAIFDIMAFGATIQNFGGTFVDSVGVDPPLPRQVRAGYTLNIIDPQGTLRLMLTTDWTRPQGGESWWALGAEGGIVVSGVGLALRAGLAAGRKGSDRRPLALGGGLVLGPVRADYSYQAWRSPARPGHRVGVRWSL